MKLSIIVPVYNCEKYLRRCMDSLIGQTIGDYEIIAVNDGSTDASLDILNEYAERYPQKLRVFSLTNGGQGRARNYGIERSSGEYLGFIDSDDWIDVSMFEKLYDAAVKDNADVVVCDLMERFSDGGERYMAAEFEAGEPLSLAGSSSNKLFRREAVGDLRFPEGLWYEDFFFSAAAILKAERVAYVREPLYFYRRGQTSTMNNNNALKNLDILRILEKLREYTQPEQYQWFVLNYVLLEAIKRVSAQTAENRSEVLKEMRGFVKNVVPSLSRCQAYRKQSRGRRLAMWLNYHCMDRLTLLLLRLSAAIK